MSIIKALICFSVCHLMVCQRMDNCDVASNGCARTIRSSDSYDLLHLSCRISLGIQVVDPDSGNPFSGHTSPPSLNSLWNKCKNNKRGLDDPLDTDLDLTVSLSHNKIKTFPDNYFCHFPSSNIQLYGNQLNDTTKLGFSPLKNCEKRCSKKLETLYLNDNHFEKVSNDSFCGLEELFRIEMRSCRVKELESDAFVHLKTLSHLDLVDNQISILSPGVFRRQKNTLTILYLSKNKLNSLSILELKNLRALQFLKLDQNQIDAIPNGLFHEMNQLKELYLDNNLIKSLTGAFNGLISLQDLHISNNNISEIRHQDFKTLVKLTFVEMNNNPINVFEPEALTNSANMDTIEISNTLLATVPNFITNSERLQTLDLSKCKIGSIKAGMFDKAVAIYAIDLSYNQLTDITKVFNNCTVNYLQLDHNKITKLDFKDFSPRLVKLSISHNHIHTFIGFDLTTQQGWHLEYVDMEHNQLSQLVNLSLPLSVLSFDVSHNNISAISFGHNYLTLVGTRTSSATKFFLHSNLLKVIDERLFTATGNFQYAFSGNPLECSCENYWLSRSSFVFHKYSLTCRPQFQRLGNQPVPFASQYYLLFDTNTSCRCEAQKNPVKNCDALCPTTCKCYQNVYGSIIHVDCSSRNINTLPLTPTVQLGSAREIHVYLDNNTISQVNLNSFLGLNNTIALYLNSTGLSEIADGSFDQLTRLRVLHLDHNKLRHISNKIFNELNSLRQLFLSHNQIQTVASNAFPSQLLHLYLDNNQLVDYSVWQLSNLKNLKNLSLHANKWSCECNYIEKFRDWLHNNSRVVEEIGQIFCVQSNGTELQLPLMTIDASHCFNSTVTNTNVLNFKQILKLLIKYLFFLDHNVHDIATL